MQLRGASKRRILLALGIAACASAPAVAGTAWRGNLTSGEAFGLTVGGAAGNAQDAMWAQGYGFEGAISCTEARAALGCQPGEQVLSFQPVELGKHGHVYLKIEDGRVSQIAWALSPVAYTDG